MGDETLAVKRERAKLDKQEKQRQKQEKKAEQKIAKEERRQSKKVEKEAAMREQEAAEAEVKTKEAEERKSKEALQAVSSRAATAAVQVHSPPPSVGAGGSIVDELSDYLATTSLTDVSRQLDQQFDAMLDSKRTKPATAAQPPARSRPPPGFASSTPQPLSSLLLTAEDESRAARIDFDRLDRAKPATTITHQQPPPSSQQQQQRSERKVEQASDDSKHNQKQRHDEEEEEDYQRYEQQQAAHLIADDGGEYEQLAEEADETESTDAQAGGGEWDELADEDDGKAAAANEVDIAALNLQDMTEDEIILAMVREFEAKQSAEHGITHDVSTADMTNKLRTHLLDQEEEGPAGFDRRSAREKRRLARAGESEEERRARKEAKYKQRAQDAAEGILDWDWSSDSDTSASGEEEGEEDDEEDDEDVDEEDEEADEDEEDENDENDEEEEDEEDKSDDESVEDDESTDAKDNVARLAVCTCFRSGSPHDPAIIAAQLESFLATDVS